MQLRNVSQAVFLDEQNPAYPHEAVFGLLMEDLLRSPVRSYVVAGRQALLSAMPGIWGSEKALDQSAKTIVAENQREGGDLIYSTVISYLCSDGLQCHADGGHRTSIATRYSFTALQQVDLQPMTT